jgi:uncharacterized protein (TIGR02145 family)
MNQKINNIVHLLKELYNTKRFLVIGIIAFVFIIAGGVVFFFAMKKLPNPPLEVKATVRGYDKVHLTWLDQGKSDGYNIYRSKEMEITYEKIGSTLNWHYEDRELDPETTYYYRVTKLLKDKESDYSVQAFATTEGIGAPTGLRAGEIGHDYIQLIWDGFRGSEGYRVYRTDSLDKPYAEITTTTNTQYFDSGLENNKAYYYVVTQIINGKESDYSKRELIATRDWTCGTSVAYDGKFYSTVLLGNQCWFQENLNYETQGGSWCYNDEVQNCERYGRLYTFETAMAGSTEENSRGICPEGWRIPSDEDFKGLERELGMTRIESNESDWRGVKLKIGDIMKVTSSCTQTGESFCGSSKFNVFLGGSRSSAGAFRYIGTHAFLWTSTVSVGEAWRRLFSIENPGVYRDKADLENAFYVRCIKNK